MRTLFFILTCLFFASQAYAQQGMKANDENSHKTPNSTISNKIIYTERHIVEEFKCPRNGYKITLSQEGTTSHYNITVTYTPLIYYITEDYYTPDGFPGFPTEEQGVLNTPGQWTVTYVKVPSPQLKSYCDLQGGILTPANHNNVVYKVKKWTSMTGQSNTVELNAASFPSPTAISLINTYNDYNDPQDNDLNPVCTKPCPNSPNGDGGSNPGDWPKPGEFVDASMGEGEWVQNGNEDNPDRLIVSDVWENLTPIIEIGGGINSYGGNLINTGLKHPSFGGHIGLYIPLKASNSISFGFNLSGSYSSANKKQFNQKPVGFQVQGMSSSIKRKGKASIHQSLLTIGVGPQINFSLSRKFAISTIIQGGYAFFKQDGFKFVQNFYEGDMTSGDPFYSTVLLNQNEVNDSGVFVMPKARLQYFINSRISIWLEANYLIRNVEFSRNELSVKDNNNGIYSFSSVREGTLIKKKEKTNISNNPGFSLGVSIRL